MKNAAFDVVPVLEGAEDEELGEINAWRRRRRERREEKKRKG